MLCSEEGASNMKATELVKHTNTKPLNFCLRNVLNRDQSVTSPAVREDCFPKTRRGKKYTFVSSDVEQLHDLFESKCPLYLKVFTELRRAHKAQVPPQ